MEKTDRNSEYKPFSKKEMQTNFSALLFMLAEQQALIGGLLQELMNNNLLSLAQLERITDLKGEPGKMDALYMSIYERFVEYFRKTAAFVDAQEKFLEYLKQQDQEKEDKDNDGVE